MSTLCNEHLRSSPHTRYKPHTRLKPTPTVEVHSSQRALTVEVHSSQWARPQPFWFKEVERYHVPRLQWVIGSRDSYLLLQCLHRCSRSWRMRAASLLGHHHVGCRHYTRCHPLGSRLCRSFWLQKRLWPYSCNAHFVSPVPTALLPVLTALFGKCLRGDFSFVFASMLLLMVDQWLGVSCV